MPKITTNSYNGMPVLPDKHFWYLNEGITRDRVFRVGRLKIVWRTPDGVKLSMVTGVVGRNSFRSDDIVAERPVACRSHRAVRRAARKIYRHAFDADGKPRPAEQVAVERFGERYEPIHLYRREQGLI